MKIVVAGSMQLADQQYTICEELKAMGHQAVMTKSGPSFLGKSDSEKEKLKLDEKYNHNAIKEFWKLMEDANALLVVNHDKHGIKNYLGGNTLLDMGHAYALNQKIYLLNPIPKMPYYQTEIIAMQPIVLNGDLTKIN
jgi:hypothetical protein